MGKNLETKLIKKTFLIPETLNKSLKFKAAKDNRKMTEVIIEALDKYLNNSINTWGTEVFKDCNRGYDIMVNEYNKRLFAKGLRLIADGIETIADAVEIMTEEELQDYVDRKYKDTIFTLDECSTVDDLKGPGKGLFKKADNMMDIISQSYIDGEDEELEEDEEELEKDKETINTNEVEGIEIEDENICNSIDELKGPGKDVFKEARNLMDIISYQDEDEEEIE